MFSEDNLLQSMKALVADAAAAMNLPVSIRLWSPDNVARHGYDAMMQGKLVTVNEKALRLMTGWIIPLLPRRQVLKFVDKMQTK